VLAASPGRRPRPVADAPALDGRELARAWLVELVASAPLDRAAELPGAGFAEDAPRLCDALLAAIRSDAALADLSAEAGGVAGTVAAESPADVVAAVEALRAATWSAFAEALHRPPPTLLANLADRLGAATAAISTAAVGATSPSRSADRGPLAAILRGEAPEQPPSPAPARPDPQGRPAETPPSPALPTPDPQGRPAETPPSPAPARPDPHGRPAETPPSPALPTPDPRGSLRGRATPDPQEALRGGATPDPLRQSASAWPTDETPGGARVEDASSFHARVAPWTAAIERRLQRHADDGLPFALLCVEVADLDRLVSSERDGEIALALEAAEGAVCAQLRPADVLVRERAGRYWLVAPETDGEAARSLAHVLAAAVAGVGGPGGAPLEAAVGIATCPVDGLDAPALEGRAEEGLFAARAAGVRVAAVPRG
jgi:GGDEF domain-containing protein